MSTGDEYEPVLLALPSLAPALALEVLPHGVTLHKLFVQADGRTHDIIVGPEIPSDHGDFPYTNCIIGRYTNRLPVGKFELSHPSGAKSELDVRTNGPGWNPRVSLHGGPRGFDLAHYQPVDATSTKLFSEAEKETIAGLPAGQVFTHTSPANDQGFPGTLRTEVLVALLDAPDSDNARTPAAAKPGAEYSLGSVLLVYRAALEEAEGVVTAVNLTQHWGFNLDASLNARLPAEERKEYGKPIDLVKDHTLRIAADKNVALDSDFLATGVLEDVKDPRDYQKGKKIGEGWPTTGFDEFWSFEKPLENGKWRVTKAELESGDLINPILAEASALGEPPVHLEGAKSGLSLKFWTNQAGVQFWTANSWDRSNARKKIHGGTGIKGTGDGYTQAAGAFLEFHEPLASFLHPGLVRNGDNTLIGPGDVYNHWVRMDVRCRNVPEEGV